MTCLIWLCLYRFGTVLKLYSSILQGIKFPGFGSEMLSWMLNHVKVYFFRKVRGRTPNRNNYRSSHDMNGWYSVYLIK